jgi:hypothetical protein
MKTAMIATLLAASLLGTTDVFARTWTSSGGQTIEGDFVKMTGTTVYLKKADGAVVTIPLGLLCEADRGEAKSLAKPADAAAAPVATVSKASQLAAKTGSSAASGHGLTEKGILTDEQIAALKIERSDDKGRKYVFHGGMGLRTLTDQEKKRYRKSGEVPFRITMELLEVKEVKGRQVGERQQGTARFYVLDSEGSVVAKGTESLAKMCPS